MIWIAFRWEQEREREREREREKKKKRNDKQNNQANKINKIPLHRFLFSSFHSRVNETIWLHVYHLLQKSSPIKRKGRKGKRREKKSTFLLHFIHVCVCVCVCVYFFFGRDVCKTKGIKQQIMLHERKKKKQKTI